MKNIRWIIVIPLLLFVSLVSAFYFTFEDGFVPKTVRHAKQEVKTKTIVFIRHAKSSHDDPKLADFDRPLNKRGKKDAPFMGKKLKERGIIPDLIVASPSARTTATILPIAKKMEYDTANIMWTRQIYRCTQTKMLNVIKEVDDKHNVIFVMGHNPATTATSNLLGDSVIANVPTTGIVSVTIETDSWKNIEDKKGKTNFFDYPGRYKK
jgi:phosphohistidine phosphatase